MSVFTVESSAFLVHEGGTKQYELVLIVQKGGESNKAALIRRHGKKGYGLHGYANVGTVQLNSGSLKQMRLLYNKLLKERNDGGYILSKSSGGPFHNVPSSENLSGASLLQLSVAHFGYKNAETLKDAMFTHFGFFGDETDAPTQAYEEPVAEIDRGENWGCW